MFPTIWHWWGGGEGNGNSSCMLFCTHKNTLYIYTRENEAILKKGRLRTLSFVLRVLGRFPEAMRRQLLRVGLLFCVIFGCFFPAIGIRWNYWFVKGFSNEWQCNFPCCTNCMEEEGTWGLLCKAKKSRNCLTQTTYENEHRLSWRTQQVHHPIAGPLGANWSSTDCIAAVWLQCRHTEVLIRLVHPE